MSVRELPPVFGGVAPHLYDPDSGVVVWFLDPPGILTRIVGHDAIDLPVALCLTGRVWEELVALGRARGVSRFTLVHDWSGTRSYAANARNHLTAWCFDHRDQLGRAVIVVPTLGPVVRAGVQLASRLLSVAGISVDTAESLADVVERERLMPLANWKPALAAVPASVATSTVPASRDITRRTT